MKRTTKSIQAEIAKGAFRPHTALSTMALAYYQQETTSFAKNMFPVCPVQLSSDNYYVFDKEDLLRDNWNRKPAYGSVDPAVISEHTENYACHVDQMMMGIDNIRQTDLNRRQGPHTKDPRQQRTKGDCNTGKHPPGCRVFKIFHAQRSMEKRGNRHRFRVCYIRTVYQVQQRKQ